MKRLQVKMLMRLHGLTEAQAHAIAALIWGGIVMNYHHLKREAAVMALTDLPPQDAATICAAVLDEAAAGMPGFDPWGNIRADAAFWADVAHPAELETYAAFALRKLGQRPLGKQMRKRLLKEAWSGLSYADRAAFLKAATKGGAHD